MQRASLRVKFSEVIHEPKIINQTSPSGGGVQHRRVITLLVNYFIKDGVFGKSKKNCRIFSLAKSLTCSKISHNLINLMCSSAIMFLFNLIKKQKGRILIVLQICYQQMALSSKEVQKRFLALLTS